MLRDHTDAVEADLQRFYGVDLGDLWRGRLSVRRLSVLIAHLPPGSAVWAAENGIPYGWSLTDVLLTDVFAALTGEQHPARPSAPKASPDAVSDRVARLLAQRERLAKTKPPSP